MKQAEKSNARMWVWMIQNRSKGTNSIVRIIWISGLGYKDVVRFISFKKAAATQQQQPSETVLKPRLTGFAERHNSHCICRTLIPCTFSSFHRFPAKAGHASHETIACATLRNKVLSKNSSAAQYAVVLRMPSKLNAKIGQLLVNSSAKKRTSNKECGHQQT